MMKLLPLNAFSDNYIWALHSDDELLIVDPGDADVVHAHIRKHDARLTAILITHHHFDHTGGLAELVDRYHPRVFGPASEDIAHLDERLGNGDECSALGLTWQVIDVPGHTAGHIAFFNPGCPGPTLFCGDTLFSGGCGRLFEGTAEQMHHSLQQFARLPGDTLVCCAHEYTLANLNFALAVEPDNQDLQQYHRDCTARREAGEPTLPSSLECELKINPFMRTHCDSVIAAADNHCGKPCTTPEQVLGAIRSWKDSF